MRGGRSTIWAKLGEAPLARALAPLARLAAEVRAPLAGSDIPGLAQAYADFGYAADAALIEALAVAAPHAVVVGKDRPRRSTCPGAVCAGDPVPRGRSRAGGSAAVGRARFRVEPGVCVLFVDGLSPRFSADACSTGFSAAEPTLFLLAPRADSHRHRERQAVRDAGGRTPSPARGRADVFLPLETSTGKPADTACLVSAMRARGVEIIAKDETRGPSLARRDRLDRMRPPRQGWPLDGRAALAGQVEAEIEAIAHRVQALRRAGWPRVRVVTDHGWLLVPGGGLPKGDDPLLDASDDGPWSRVARLGDWRRARRPTRCPGPSTRTCASPSHPAPTPSALARAYAHGGVSLQECIVPDIVVGEASGAAPRASLRERGSRASLLEALETDGDARP